MKTTYTFRSSSGLAVTVLRGNGAAKMVGGGGGWEIEDRPRRVGLTIWKGRQPYQMDVPILFDGWDDDTSQEVKISILNQMQMSTDLNQPPTVRIGSQGAPETGLPIKGAQWVISSIDWGDQVIWDTGDTGKPYRLRQDAVVHLIQYVAEDRLKVQNKTNPIQLYQVVKGDTFKRISQKKYHTIAKWRVIMAANNIRDPKKITKLVGKKIRIP